MSEEKEMDMPPEQPAEPSFRQRVEQMVERFQASVDRLAEEVKYGVGFAERKQELADKLYEENRAYKDDLLAKFKAKLVLGVIEQLDRADREVAAFGERDASERAYTNLLAAFSELADEFREMLQNRFEVGHFRSQPGDAFQPGRHKAVDTLPTSDPAADKTIARTRRYGYETADGRVLRPEFVDVYYYVADAE